MSETSIYQAHLLTPAYGKSILTFVEAYRVEDAWEALGDRTRRAIVECLAQGPRSVGELAAELPVSRPAVSQHLKVLKVAGLVIDQAEATRRIYRLNPAGLGALRDQLDTFWDRALSTYKNVVEQAVEEKEMTTLASAMVRREVVVEASIERAFTVFTERFGDFKPAEHTLLDSPLAETVFEPKVGGHIFDRGIDGSECRWARVFAYEPPDRVVFSWDIGPQWQLESDPNKTSEVEVRFTAVTPRRTRVELEHRNIDRHGPGWQAVSEGVGNDAGWPLYLARFAALFSEGS